MTHDAVICIPYDCYICGERTNTFEAYEGYCSTECYQEALEVEREQLRKLEEKRMEMNEDE